MTDRHRSRVVPSQRSLTALRRANPRKDPDFASAVLATAGLERRIMSTGPASSGFRRRLWPRTPRRRITLIAVAGALVLLGCTAAYGGMRFPGLAKLEPVPTPPPLTAPDAVFQSEGFMDWRQYHDEYVAWTHRIELPAGATWRGPDPAGRKPDADGRGYSFYVGAGAKDAIWEGMGHWAIAWGAAAKAGDGERAARAEAWVVHLRALLHAGSDETRDDMDRQTAHILDAAIDAAKKGHVGKLSHLDMLVGATVPYWTPPAEGRGPGVSAAH
jgi:hypothetical protein